LIYLLLVTFVLVLVYSGLGNRRSVLYALVFFSPWSGIDVDLGLRVTAYLLCSVALVLVFLILALNRSISIVQSLKCNPWLLVFIFYTLVVSIEQSFSLPAWAFHDFGERSGQFRSLTQILMFGISFIPVLLLAGFVRERDTVLGCARAYLYSIAILAALGYLQLLIWYSTGSDPFPVGFINSLFTGDDTRSGIDWVGNSPVYRMSSFAGEPKSMGVALAVGLLIIQSAIGISASGRRSRFASKLLWLVLFLALVLTWSTSGAFLWIIGTSAMVIFGAGNIRGARVSRNLILTLCLLTVVVGGGYGLIVAKWGGGGAYVTVAENRFVERDPIEDFDETVLRFLEDHPDKITFGVGLGNVHIYAARYIPTYARPYMKGNIFVAKSGYLRILSELGVVGLIFFSMAYFWPLMVLRNLSRSASTSYYDRRLVTAFGIFASVMFFMGMARTYVWPQMYLTMGLASALIILLRRRPLQSWRPATDDPYPVRKVSSCES
jgi:hypothetical protein